MIIVIVIDIQRTSFVQLISDVDNYNLFIVAQVEDGIKNRAAFRIQSFIYSM